MWYRDTYRGIAGIAQHYPKVGLYLEPFRILGRPHSHGCIYTVSKNDTDVALYIFNLHQPISVISGRNVAERVHYQTVVSYPTSPN